nr:metallophosphoesterase [Streptomyces sp. SID13031]
MGSAPASIYALTPLEHTDPVRVDFTADTGDGFDATFAVARLLAGGMSTSDPAKFAGPADLLVLGGDEVYPVASAEAYRRRFTAVFRAARYCYPKPPGAASRVHGPPVLALPGNHDWYDGLSAFRRTFCESWTRMKDKVDDLGLTKVGGYEPAETTVQREVAGDWTTVQSRSYFAIRVHPRWWIWGVDSQLNAPIDPEQLAYFDAAKGKLNPGDGVVLCTSTPSWLEAEGERPPEYGDRETPLTTVVNFRRRYLGLPEDERLRMILTGDKHHYALYVPAEKQPAEDDSLKWIPGPVLVTCGGGGAFTSPTHHLKKSLSVPWGRQKQDVSRRVTRYGKLTEYPSVDESKKMRLQIWKMGWHNGPGLPAAIGLLLTCVFWTAAGDRIVHLPSIIAGVVLAVITCIYALTGIRGQRDSSPLARGIKVIVAGVAHAAVHLLAIALVVWLVRELPTLDGRPWWLWPAVYLPFVILGTLVFTIYLLVSDLFGYHETEAFASTRSEKFKSLLRLTFEDELVSVEVVGLNSVPPARSSKTPISEMTLHPHQVDHFGVPRTGQRFKKIPSHPTPEAPPPGGRESIVGGQ